MISTILSFTGVGTFTFRPAAHTAPLMALISHFLGTGGLTRAYRTGCRIALDKAGVVDMIPSAEYLCEVDYGLWDRVRYEMAGSPAELGETAYADRVSFAFAVREEDEESVMKLLTRVTNGKADLIETGRLLRPWDAAQMPAEE